MNYRSAAFPQRRILWAAHASHPGFVATIALQHLTTNQADPTDLRQPIVGIAYGFPGQPTSWWNREVLRGLQASGRSYSAAQAILSSYDEVSEIHVLPGHQGQGIGRKLLSDLLTRLQNPVALLSTPEVPNENNAAWGLYRSMGFHDVLRSFHFASDPRPFGVLTWSRDATNTGEPPQLNASDHKTTHPARYISPTEPSRPAGPNTIC